MIIDERTTKLITSLRNDLSEARQKNFILSDEIKKLNINLSIYKDSVEQFKEILVELDEMVLLNG